MRQFWGETSPRNTAFSLRANQTYLLASKTSKVAFVSTCLEMISFLNLITYTVPCGIGLTRKDLNIASSHLPEGTSVSALLGGPKAVFRGLRFTPKLPPNPFYLESDLVRHFDFASKKVDDIDESSEHNLFVLT